MIHTLCPELWKSITIDCVGNVYSCCLIKPSSLGNIYTSKLRNLINSSNIIRERVKSLKGTLECYHSCNWLDKTAYPNVVGDECEYVDYDQLTYLHLNFGEKCNISCVMCKQRIRNPTSSPILDPEMLIQNIDVSPFTDIVIQGGEPLYIPECIRYLNYLESVGKKYTLLTNGLLIDYEIADKLSKGAKRVTISLNAASREIHELVNRGSRWTKILDNIQLLTEARKRNGTDLEVWGRMTITNYSLHEVSKFLREWQSFGFDHINFGYDRETVPALLDANPEFKAQLRKEVMNELANLDPSNVDALRLRQLGLIGGK